MFALKKVRANLSRHAPGDFAHGREQGKIARNGLYGFVSHAGSLIFEQRFGHGGISREVQISEQSEIGPQV